MEFEEVAQVPSPNRPDLPNDSSEKDGTVQTPRPGTSVGHGHEDDEDEHDHDHASHGTTVHAHAFLLSFGLLFVLPFGVLAGRWGRTISPVWFKVHWILNMAVAAPVIVLGWVLGLVAVWKHGAGHLDDAHKVGCTGFPDWSEYSAILNLCGVDLWFHHSWVVWRSGSVGEVYSSKEGGQSCERGCDYEPSSTTEYRACGVRVALYCVGVLPSAEWAG